MKRHDIHPAPGEPDAEPLWLQVLTILLMAVSVVAQGLLAGQLLKFASMPHSEQRAWFGMGLMAMTAGALVVAAPGMLAAVYRFTLALRRHREEGASVSLVANAAVMLMPIGVMLLFALPGPPPEASGPSPSPSSTAKSPPPPDESAEGFRWANRLRITAPEDCTTGSPSFQDGCRYYATACRGLLPCSYAAPTGETVNLFAR